MRCPECGSDGPHTDAAGWRTCGTCHASWMVDPGRQVVRLARHGTTTSGIEAPADHDRCPDIEFLDMHAAIDALDGLGVAAEGLDGWTAEGIFQRVTERGEEGDVSPAWSKPDIYMIEVVELLTNRLVTRTDFRNLRKVKVL